MKNTGVALAEIKMGQHTLDTYHIFDQNCWDFQGGKKCLIFFSKPELHDLAWETQISYLTIAKHIFNMFFKFFCRCVCCSLAALVHVKLPVSDLSLTFSGDLFSVWKIKIIHSSNIGLWTYSPLNNHCSLRQQWTLKLTGCPAAQVLMGVERFILGKNEGRRIWVFLWRNYF